MKAEEELKLLKQQIGDLIVLADEVIPYVTDMVVDYDVGPYSAYDNLIEIKEKLLELSRGKNEEDKNQLKFFD